MATIDYFADVLAFRRKFSLYVGAAPSVPDRELVEWWAAKLCEEAFETAAAAGLDVVAWSRQHARVIAGKRVAGDIVEIADGACDVHTSALHIAAICGFDPDPVWREVHRSNMAKHGDDAGNVRKPSGWRPPDVAGALSPIVDRARHCECSSDPVRWMVIWSYGGAAHESFVHSRDEADDLARRWDGCVVPLHAAEVKESA